MKLYTELAEWWPLLSPPEDYDEEASLYRHFLTQAAGAPPTSLLELGSGGGHLASHLPADIDVVLSDLSPDMLAVSRALNPTRQHVHGDMRTLRLGRLFDAVLIHDAVMYLTSEADLRSTMVTAAAHCRPGGAVLVLPDVVRETFREDSLSGGHSAQDGRALRLLEWHWDPDPGDSKYRVDFALLLREPDGSVRSVHEFHEMGLYDRKTWWSAIRDAGLRPLPADVPPGVEIGEVFLSTGPDLTTG